MDHHIGEILVPPPFFPEIINVVGQPESHTHTLEVVVKQFRADRAGWVDEQQTALEKADGGVRLLPEPVPAAAVVAVYSGKMCGGGQEQQKDDSSLLHGLTSTAKLAL